MTERIFSAQWEREMFDGLIAHPHCISIAFFLSDAGRKIERGGYCGRDLIALANDIIAVRTSAIARNGPR